MNSDALAAQLFREIASIPCINTHSHLLPEATRLAEPEDALAFFKHAYPGADLVSAGMSDDEKAKALEPGLPLEQRWEIFEPYWRWIRLTGYSQAILEGFRDLLGFEDLNGDTVVPISEALQAHCRPGLYREVLQGRSNIEISVMNMDALIEVDREFFLPMPRLNRFSMLNQPSQLEALEKDHDCTITALKDLTELIRSVCRQWKGAGVAGVKMSQSYHRRMDFAPRAEADAVAAFDRLRRGEFDGLESGEGRLLEDYIVYECCRAASEADLTIQFHQGVRAGNFGGLEGCSPAPLSELLRTFKEARFDLSHSGYPYLREAAVLAKTFSNVYLNMSWIHAISPMGVRTDLLEWLRMVPINKILAYGDDMYHVEAAYGHLKMARQNFAIALAEMIAEGLTSESVALDVARAAFRDNPAAIYGIDG